MEEYTFNADDYKFTNYNQYIEYIEKNFAKFNIKQIKKVNATLNKVLTSTGNLKKKYSNEDACAMLKDLCNYLNLKDYYVY